MTILPTTALEKRGRRRPSLFQLEESTENNLAPCSFLLPLV